MIGEGIDDLDRDFRVFREELRQLGDQPVGGEGGERRDGHGRALLAVLQPAAGGCHDVEGLGQRPGELLALLGGHGVAAEPVEQRQAEPLLELPDLMADGGLGDVQLLRGLGKGAGAGGGLEAAQGVEGRQAGHRHRLHENFS